ncbi:uncharacterized protein EDB91DRAFT_1256893 [Suillus paluster]|uniref:uncharacterized protein n=1 Tax=Suillus paluster TaxID=48578 RepID=UPI001B85C136|nr:uncharacterized protein EDB91DRAFT_1256893 [Suillus paluster]KAG1720621.1 hypothetical protein EDB91DRAFT_1256893 [Suillus paluster]
MSCGVGSSRLKGLSKSVISHHFRGQNRQSYVLMAGRQTQCLEAAAVSRQAEFQEMSAEDREMVEDMMDDYGMNIKPLPYTAPPGEEGLDLSHEGGEYEAFEGLAHEIAGISGL